jgi:hypothetical protein
VQIPHKKWAVEKVPTAWVTMDKIHCRNDSLQRCSAGLSRQYMGGGPVNCCDDNYSMHGRNPYQIARDDPVLALTTSGVDVSLLLETTHTAPIASLVTTEKLFNRFITKQLGYAWIEDYFSKHQID